MKKFYGAVAMAAIVIAMAGVVYADGSVGVTATATVVNKCTAPTGGSIAFTLDPSVVSAVTASTGSAGNSAPSIRCTANTVHAVTCPAGGNLLMGGADAIPYTVTCPGNVTGQGFGTAVPIDFDVNVAYAAFQNAQAGDHSDTITITVAY